MAAGRYGGRREAELVEREPSRDLPRRDFNHSKDINGRFRIGNPVRNRDTRDRDRDRLRIRQKDIKEREHMNGGFDGSAGGPKQCGQSMKVIDREPGELSSESGSDSAVGCESQGKEHEISKLENGNPSSPVSRKRKFSPIVWDRDEKKVEASKSEPLQTTSSHAPLSFTRNSDCQSVVAMQENKVVMSSNKSQEASPFRDVEQLHVENTSSELPEDLHCDTPTEKNWGDDEAMEQQEEDYISTRNISSSRWAGDANSPAEKGENSEEDMVTRRKMRKSVMGGVKLSKGPSSPESGEVEAEDIDVLKARSFTAEGDMNSRPSSGDCSSQDDSRNGDHMELDGASDNGEPSLSRSDADSEDGANLHETQESQALPQRTVNMLQGCRSVDEFERLNKINEGTYGVVYRARDKKSGEIVALKKVKMEKEREGFPLTSLREINILLSFHNPSIVNVKEVVIGSSLDSIFMVMEYMEHDLKALMESMKQPFSQSEVKCLMLQLLEGCKYLHDNWVLHRDLKTSNLLLNNQGELKICDFGLARQYGSPLKPYTHMVVTLWYRAPELLLGAKQYSTAIDMWSVGCIMAELLSKEPLFSGKTEFDQLDKIFRILGTPNETIWPGFSKLPGVKVNFVKHQYNQLRKRFPATSFTGSPVLSDAGFDLLNRLLTYDPEKRMSADEALRHEWFHEVPLPKSKEFMPTFPAVNAQDRRVRRVFKSPDPLEEQRRRELQQAEFGTGGLFG